MGKAQQSWDQWQVFKVNTKYVVVVVLRSPIHANEPSEYNGMLYRTSNRVLNNGIKVIILICMDGTSQYHHHQICDTFGHPMISIAILIYGTTLFSPPPRIQLSPKIIFTIKTSHVYFWGAAR